MVRQVEGSLVSCIVLRKPASQALTSKQHVMGKEDDTLLGGKQRKKLVDRVTISWRKKGKAKEDYSADTGSNRGWRLSRTLRHKECSLERVVDHGTENLDEIPLQWPASKPETNTGVQNVGKKTKKASVSKDKIAVAVSQDQANKGALKWAIANFVPEGGPVTLVHVRPPVRLIPTPLGTFVPVEQVSAEIAAAYMKDANAKTEELLLDHQWMCDVHKVDVNFVIVESFCVEKALVDEVTRLGITKLVLGCSSRSTLARKLRPGISGYVSRNAPSFCTVLLVSKGRLLSVREAEVVAIQSLSSTSSSDEGLSCSGLSMTSTSSLDGSVVEEDCRFPELLQSPLGSQPRSRSSIAPKPQPLPLGVGRGQQYLPKHPLHRRVFSSPVAFSGLHKLPVQQTFIGPHGSQLFVSPFYDPSAKRESAPMQSARLTVSMNSMLEGMNGFQSGEFGSQSQERLKSTVLVQSCQSGVCAVRQELVTDGLDVDCVAECINTSQFSGNPSRDDELAGAEIQPATANLCAQENGNPRVNLMGAVGASNPLVNHVDFTFELPDICSSRPANVGSCLSRHKNRDLDEVDKLKLQLAIARIAVKEAQRHARIQVLRCKEAVAAALVAQQKEQMWAALQEQETKKRELACREAELAKRRAEEETKKRNEAVAVAERARQAVETEMQLRKEAEAKAQKEMEARNKVSEILKAHQPYREYSYEELRIASSDFSPELKIGEGGYGAVYQGKIHHTTVAIKVLNPGGLQGSEEFHREVELLRHIHHPHMVLLLGCCPDKGCLVYEFMANGSLEDCLLGPTGGTALPWYTRFRIAAEVATALLFLHSAKPVPIVHRDLKPANILLDRNFVSKIGDVGLAKLVPIATGGRGYNSVFHRDTMPVGTFAYIDPEYQRTGSFGPKSDVYALGIVLLQLLTGRQAVGVAETAEVAIEMGEFEDILDKSAGKWPVEEALGMARLALQCAEMKRKNRPELDTDVIRYLAYCRQCAEDYLASDANRVGTLPADQHSDVVRTIFLCPILQEVMADPVIAADGHTYDNQAIRLWLESHDTSPMTNLKLAHRDLTPNHAIRSAIREWQTNNSQEVYEE